MVQVSDLETPEVNDEIPSPSRSLRPDVQRWSGSLDDLPVPGRRRGSFKGPKNHAPLPEGEDTGDSPGAPAKHPFVGAVDARACLSAGTPAQHRADRAAFAGSIERLTLGSETSPVVVGCLATFSPLATPVLSDSAHRPAVAATRCAAARAAYPGVPCTLPWHWSATSNSPLAWRIAGSGLAG